MSKRIKKSPMDKTEIRQCGSIHAMKIWEEDKIFQSLLLAIKNKTIVDHFRCFVLYQFAKRFSGLASYAEVGVYKGGTAKLLAKCTKSHVYLFDTFNGMPATDPEKDLHKQFDFNDTSLVAVKAFLNDVENVSFIEGKFPDSIPKDLPEEFAFVHIDVDIYQSVKDCCNFFYPKLLVSGVMIFDDYGFNGCPGAKLAVDEYFGKDVVYLPTGQAMAIKL